MVASNESQKPAETPLGGDGAECFARNSFLEQLLTLQQDGSAAISSPGTWSARPLLQVRTHLDDVIEGLMQEILDGERNHDIARWHFFVGSPGNGKSAGTGELARRLAEAGFSVRDTDGNELADIPLATIPYRLEVFAPGQKYSCAYIAQDASVVPDPYAEKADPAAALVDLLKVAADKGNSLIVCTNRGVLERAFAAHYLDSSCNGKVWFDTIRAAVLGKEGFSRKFDGVGRKNFDAVSFRYTSLDRRSLLVGRHEFEKLVDNAVNHEHWVACDGCTARNRCPFFQNMRWLTDERSRASFITVVRHAEILSGQVVVFREALALLSVVLAGCPHDYQNGSPCSWVHARIAEGRYFSLLSRRVYMTLFSAYAPFGLEPFGEDRAAQQRALKSLADSTTGERAQICQRAMLEVVDKNPSISADVGVGRLVGPNGVFRTMDCACDIQPDAFYERWGDSGKSPFDEPAGPFSDLEKYCARIWTTLRDAAEARGDVDGASYRWLSRWITAHTHRAGSLLTGTFNFASEIESIVKILSLEDPPNEEGLKLIGQIESDLWKMLDLSGEGTQISAFARLKGEWVKAKLKPRIDDPPAEEGRQPIVLGLKFGSDTQVPLNALAFAWLKRRGDRGMLAASFPLEFLEPAEDALIKAASESHYFKKDDDVEMIVTLPPPGDRKVFLKRARGQVIIDGL